MVGHMQADLPRNFPDLPVRDYWSANVLQAHKILDNMYQQALQLLCQEDSDRLHLQIHINRIYDQVPLLEAINNKVDDIDWISCCAHAFGELLNKLKHAALAVNGQEHSTVDIVTISPMHSASSGSCGRPHFVFDAHWLVKAVSSTCRIPLQTLVNALGIHRNTLHHHLHLHSFSIHQFSDIMDHELNVLIQYYKLKRPSSGLQFVTAYLKSYGISVQHRHIQESLQRIDPLGWVLCS
ncbi:hypothetical protein JVT61DRAFT_10986 [Boletus reticuloceps]|uniref:Uncharacterized protein n=1 Tax=Boletus reticuloceps TaxID=495285 RepID=A0A8I2YF83_9AGAM|nr:hypothetical protein JVT61DRAFT_10986 [Boletus reticuloceps]